MGGKGTFFLSDVDYLLINRPPRCNKFLNKSKQKKSSQNPKKKYQIFGEDFFRSPSSKFCRVVSFLKPCPPPPPPGTNLFMLLNIGTMEAGASTVLKKI